MEKYAVTAKALKMIHAKIISPADIYFDIRTMLKCRWGCEDPFNQGNIKCLNRGTTYQECVEMINSYEHILLIHSNDPQQLNTAALEIERNVFLDGYYFAFTILYCSLCKKCSVDNGGTCPTPEKIRPCDSIFGIDVYKTARGLGLPIDVLKDKNEIQNRYAFVLID